MEELRCVVPVVDVPFVGFLKMGRDHAHSLNQGREIPRPAQELAAQEGFGCHDRVEKTAAARPPRLIEIGYSGFVSGCLVQITGASLQDFLWDLDSGEMGASKGED